MPWGYDQQNTHCGEQMNWFLQEQQNSKETKDYNEGKPRH